MSIESSREEIVSMGRRLWERRAVAANDGNLSVRLEDGSFLATPTGVSKGFMKSEQIVHLAADGSVHSGGRPSSEIKMHLAIYAARPDVHAIVHAHPAYATTFAVAGIPLDQALLPEAILLLGAVPIVPYGTPSTDELSENVIPYAIRGDAMLLAHHGAVTLGHDLETAYYRMETLEHVAQITYQARQLGAVQPLSDERILELVNLREKYRLKGRVDLAGFGLAEGREGV
ncbi:class II aldolase/adducin family protein [bacterium]|nr:class II aldolase/adducin family protein [bacterium]